MLPIVLSTPRPDLADYLKPLDLLHADIVNWFERNPDRQMTVRMPNFDFHEDEFFDVADQDPSEMLRLSQEYGLIPVILYKRIENKLIIKTHLFIHSCLTIFDDDQYLRQFSQFSDDQYVFSFGLNPIDARSFWKLHDRDQAKLFSLLWS